MQHVVSVVSPIPSLFSTNPDSASAYTSDASRSASSTAPSGASCAARPRIARASVDSFCTIKPDYAATFRF